MLSRQENERRLGTENGHDAGIHTQWNDKRPVDATGIYSYVSFTETRSRIWVSFRDQHPQPSCIVTYLFVPYFRIAGSDSTSNWARMTMLCLLTCPPAYMALQREIDAASACGDLSGPIAKITETRSLPYLDAVLREAIRLLPPSVSPSKLSPTTPRNRSAAINHTVCGFHVPAGTQIGANVPGILRSEATFGSDAQCFRPERWLEALDSAGPERLHRMKSTLDIVFGAGKFQCMGATIAWAEVRKLFVEVSREF